MFKEDSIDRIRALKHDADRLLALRAWYEKMSSSPECLWHNASFGNGGDAGNLWGITCISFNCTVAFPSSNAFPPSLESGEAVTRAFREVLNDLKWPIILRMADVLTREAKILARQVRSEVENAQAMLDSVVAEDGEEASKP